MSIAIAKLWANRIISGSRSYNQVPAKLKESVALILKEANREDLIIE
jgi:hypothetical protein